MTPFLESHQTFFGTDCGFLYCWGEGLQDWWWYKISINFDLVRFKFRLSNPTVKLNSCVKSHRLCPFWFHHSKPDPDRPTAVSTGRFGSGRGILNNPGPCIAWVPLSIRKQRERACNGGRKKSLLLLLHFIFDFHFYIFSFY